MPKGKMIYDHVGDQILGNTTDVLRTLWSLSNIWVNLVFLSQIEPREL